MRIRTRNIRIFILLMVGASILFLFSRRSRPSPKIVQLPLWSTSRTTTLNLTLWNAKSFPEEKEHHQLDCKTHRSLERNVSLPETILGALSKDLARLPGKEELCAMTLAEVELYYQRYFSTLQTLCKHSVRLGNSKDGGWDICADNFNSKNYKCLVYSFGIQYDFTFDDEIAEVFGCEVHSFDPSMHQSDHIHKPSVYFHATGISNYDGVTADIAKWKMRTFRSIREELQHIKRSPDIIKMDIESWEWQVIPDMLATSQFDHVQQFLVEFHAESNYEDRYVKEYWIHRLLIIRDLYKAGFRIFWIGRNIQCTYQQRHFKRVLYRCFEVSFMRVNNTSKR